MTHIRIAITIALSSVLGLTSCGSDDSDMPEGSGGASAGSGGASAGSGGASAGSGGASAGSSGHSAGGAGHPGSGGAAGSAGSGGAPGGDAGSGGESGGAHGGPPQAPVIDSVSPLAGALHVTWTNTSPDCDQIELLRNKDGGEYAVAYTLTGAAEAQHDAQVTAPGTYCYRARCVIGDETSPESNEECGTL